jgi:hypothetical protein
MQENNKGVKIDVSSSLTIYENMLDAENSDNKEFKASTHARVYEGIVNTLENKMFDRISEVVDRISEVEGRFEKSLRKDRVVYVTTIGATLAFGFTGIILAILFK